MKIGYKISIVFFLIFSVINNSCSRNNMEDEFQDTEENIPLSIKGRVLDDSGSILNHPTVRFQGKPILVGEDGVFSFESELNKDSVLIYCEKPGYFSTVKKFQAIGSGIHELEIILVKKPDPQLFFGENGGTLKFENGLELTFPAYSIENMKDRTIYSGTVKVYAKSFKSDQKNFETILPGDGSAVGASGEMQMTTPSVFCMVELFDETDQPLQIARGKSVEVRLNASSVEEYGEKTYSWHFNERKGYWENIGELIKEDSVYVFNAPFFSSWAIGSGSDLGLIKYHVYNHDGTPFTSVKLELLDLETKQKVYFYPDKNGIAVTKYPINREAILSIYDYCDKVIRLPSKLILYGKLYGYTRPHWKYKPELIHLKGTALSCNGNESLPMGAIQVRQGNNYQYFTFKDGLFDFYFPKCQGLQYYNVSVDVLDFSGSKSAFIPDQGYFNDNEYTIPPVKVCESDDSLSYVKFNVGDSTYLFYEKKDTMSMRKLSPTSNAYEMIFQDMTGRRKMIIIATQFYLGSYPLRQATFFDGWDSFSIYGGGILHSYPAELKFDEIGGVGQRVSGSFSGQMREFTSQQILPMNGNFSFIRRK